MHMGKWLKTMLQFYLARCVHLTALKTSVKSQSSRQEQASKLQGYAIEAARLAGIDLRHVLFCCLVLHRHQPPASLAVLPKHAQADNWLCSAHTHK